MNSDMSIFNSCTLVANSCVLSIVIRYNQYSETHMLFGSGAAMFEFILAYMEDHLPTSVATWRTHQARKQDPRDELFEIARHYQQMAGVLRRMCMYVGMWVGFVVCVCVCLCFCAHLCLSVFLSA